MSARKGSATGPLACNQQGAFRYLADHRSAGHRRIPVTLSGSSMFLFLDDEVIVLEVVSQLFDTHTTETGPVQVIGRGFPAPHGS